MHFLMRHLWQIKVRWDEKKVSQASLFQWIRCWRRSPPWSWSSVTPDSVCFSLLFLSFYPFSSSPAAPHLCSRHLFGTWLQRRPVGHWFNKSQSSAETVLTRVMAHLCQVVFSSWVTGGGAGRTRLPLRCHFPFLYSSLGHPPPSPGLNFLLGSSLR